MTDETSDQEIYFNGINGDSGEYDLPPMSGDDLFAFIRGESSPDNLEELKTRFRKKTARVLGVKEGVDPKRLDEAGWGIIFAHDADPAIEEALSELIAKRRNDAGKYFKIYKNGDGYRPDEKKSRFLARHGASPGPADPEKVPYYLLIVGSPQAIPYRFQTQLDVQYAVGRIHFDTPHEYANYASSVVAAESGAVKLGRTMTFFGVANEGDSATQLSAEHLVQPLHENLASTVKDWTYKSYMREEATRGQLAELLGGEKTPALLFTASHGMAFSLDSPRLLNHQGALLCQDWPGPDEWKKPIPQDFYFAGDHLSSDANLLGQIAFFFACYGAGTPEHDEFYQQAFKDRERIAPHPFMGQLPVKMLGHPRGGALAVIGHVERTWSYSFQWPNADAQTTVYESTMQRLLEGHPVGSAIEYFNERYAEIATMLNDELEQIEFNKQVDPYEVVELWTTNNDARGYTVIGDPAVRLPVVESGEVGQERPQITANIPADKSASADGDESEPPPVPEETITPGESVAHSFSLGGVDVKAAIPAILAALKPDAGADLKTVTVQTFTSADIDDPENRQLLIETSFTLDGGLETALSTTFGEVDPQLMTLHQGLVKEAAEARLAFIELLARIKESV